MVPWDGLQCVIMLFPGCTRLFFFYLFFIKVNKANNRNQCNQVSRLTHDYILWENDKNTRREPKGQVITRLQGKNNTYIKTNVKHK